MINKEEKNKLLKRRILSDFKQKEEKVNSAINIKIEDRFLAQNNIEEKITEEEENLSEVDDQKRLFLKLAGLVGLGVAGSALFPSKAGAYVAGSTPTSNVVGLKNSSNTRINPATEEKQNELIGHFALQMDDSSTANVTYVGTASIGSLTSGAVWRIIKIDETSGLSITWADGNDSFDNIWDNRTSLTYL